MRGVQGVAEQHDIAVVPVLVSARPGKRRQDERLAISLWP